MADKTLTQELHDMIFGENYAMTVELTDTDDCINSQELYHLCKYTSKTCNLITTPLIDKKGQAIPSGVFTLFMKYTGIPPGSIRDDLLSWTSEREEEIANLSKHYFKRDKLNFTGWYVKMSNTNNAVDKLWYFSCANNTRGMLSLSIIVVFGVRWMKQQTWVKSTPVINVTLDCYILANANMPTSKTRLVTR